MNLNDISKKEFIGQGFMAECYLLENGKVFKEFNDPLKISDIEKFKYFLNFKNENFVFPFEFIYDNKKFYGYITEKAKGKILSEVFSSSNLEKLSTHYLKLERNTNFISEGNIIMHDFHRENIMYDGELLQVIDPDEYEISNSLSNKQVIDYNNYYHRTTLGTLFMSNVNLSLNKKIRYVLDKIPKYAYLSIKPSEMIIDIKEKIYGCVKEDFDTLDDLNEILRR